MKNAKPGMQNADIIFSTTSDDFLVRLKIQQIKGGIFFAKDLGLFRTIDSYIRVAAQS